MWEKRDKNEDITVFQHNPTLISHFFLFQKTSKHKMSTL